MDELSKRMSRKHVIRRFAELKQICLLLQRRDKDQRLRMKRKQFLLEDQMTHQDGAFCQIAGASPMTSKPVTPSHHTMLPLKPFVRLLSPSQRSYLSYSGLTEMCVDCLHFLKNDNERRGPCKVCAGLPWAKKHPFIPPHLFSVQKPERLQSSRRRIVPSEEGHNHPHKKDVCCRK